MSPDLGPAFGSLDGFLPISLGPPGVGLACTSLALPIGNLFSSITFGQRLWLPFSENGALLGFSHQARGRWVRQMPGRRPAPLRLNHRGKLTGLKDPGEDSGVAGLKNTQWCCIPR